jgi:NAD(P)-dependent dehydrogenase (short-subunit alcohol dehydrogenase family)
VSRIRAPFADERLSFWHDTSCPYVFEWQFGHSPPPSLSETAQSSIENLKSSITSLVTGGNSGIGKAIARGLAEHGGRVLLLCRSEKRGEAARAEIAEATGNDQVELVRCDLADLADVRRAAAEVRERCDRLDVLVNNAGIYRGRYEESADGLELTWAVNHFAPFLLTMLLRDRLAATATQHGEARVVNVSSDAHRGPALDLEEVRRGGPSEARFNGMLVYAQTKLANVLFAREWARRFGPGGGSDGCIVAANAVHPGVVATGIWQGAGGWLAKVAGLFTFLYASPERGAAGPLRLATDPALEGVSGRYFNKTTEKAPSEPERSGEAARRLWDVSEQVVEQGARR